MQTAEKFKKELDRIPRDRAGFRDIRQATAWIVRVRRASCGVSYPMGADSVDPTERHQFADGSALVVANPTQQVFDLFIVEG